MALFGRYSHNIGGNVKEYNFNYVPCGAECKKCGKGPGCTKSDNHSVMQGHASNSGTKVGNENGCGHSWN